MAFNIFATATSDIPLANLDANFTLIGAAAAASTLYPTASTSITYGTAGTTHNFSGSGLAVTGTLSATGAVTISSGDGINTGSTAALSRISGGTVNDGAVVVLGGSTHASIASTGHLRVGTSDVAVWGSTGLAVTGTLSATGVVTFSNYGVGTATFNGSGVISSVSDETWKIKDGAPVNTDAMLNKLEPGYWYYNDEKKETFGKDRQLGFYAQNVNAAIGPEAAPEPETVVTKNDDGTETSVTKPWGYYDRSVLAVTVMSLQKALATIESLTARITALEAK